MNQTEPAASQPLGDGNAETSEEGDIETRGYSGDETFGAPKPSGHPGPTNQPGSSEGAERDA